MTSSGSIPALAARRREPQGRKDAEENADAVAEKRKGAGKEMHPQHGVDRQDTDDDAGEDERGTVLLGNAAKLKSRRTRDRRERTPPPRQPGPGRRVPAPDRASRSPRANRGKRGAGLDASGDPLHRQTSSRGEPRFPLRHTGAGRKPSDSTSQAGRTEAPAAVQDTFWEQRASTPSFPRRSVDAAPDPLAF